LGSPTEAERSNKKKGDKMGKKPRGRTLAEFQPLQPAEKLLLGACADGLLAEIGQDRPTERTDDNAVRAEFLRFLVLGGDDDAPVHEQGVRLQGAWVEGVLNLSNALIPFGLSCLKCYFEQPLESMGSRFQGLVSLSGSYLPGWWADRANLNGSVFLRDGFKASGEVRLLGAQIEGNVDCSKAEFEGKEGDALSVDGAKVAGDVFLRDGFKASGEVRLLGAQIDGDVDCSKAKFDGKEGDALSMNGAEVRGSVFLRDGFKASGAVSLPGVQIGGSLSCSKAEFDGKEGDALSMDGAKVAGDVFLRDGFKASGEVRLVGAQIDGDVDCSKAEFDGKGGHALSLERASVRGAFFFRRLLAPVQHVNLTGASVSILADDLEAWGEGVVLDGFTYVRIGGGADTDAQSREVWLDRQCVRHSGKDGQGDDFRPQPWRQLQKVLHDMGHAEGARQVAIAFEHRLRRANLIGQAPQHWGVVRRWCYLYTSLGFHWLFYVLIGYGYRPLRLATWMFAVWLFCAVVYWYAALQGVMGPSNPLVFQNSKYANCQSNWYLCETLPEEYTGFSPLTYSLDVILPLVNLQQESDWAPLIPTPKVVWWEELGRHWTLKHLVRGVLWLEIIFGWVASLLLVAVVSGLTKRRED
jgi:sRNA-binding regulator protein Hfq